MKIGFIGAGTMAEAIVKGLLSSGKYSSDNICVGDVSQSRLDYFEATYSVAGHNDNKRVAEASDVIVFAVKPDKAQGVVRELKNSINEEKLLITIVAGVSTGALEIWTEKKVPVVRVMPNTPCIMGKGISAISPGKYCEGPHVDIAQAIFDCVGDTVRVPESQMNGITGVSGSGPAYIYLVIEAMIDAAVNVGIPRNIATQLVLKTVTGSAEMVAMTREHPAVLKAQVMSPGGTTAAGLNELEDGKLRSLFTNAVKAAAQRAEEIGE